MTKTRENLDYGMKIINPIAQNKLVKKNLINVKINVDLQEY